MGATVADYEVLGQAGDPILLLAQLSESEATDLAFATRLRAPEAALVTVLRGTKMRTESQLFDEFAAALQFPYYFGENWNAFSECLADLSWLPATGHVLVITAPTDLLGQAPEDALSVLVRTLERVGAEWRRPNPPLRPRGDVPFHVLFQVTEVAQEPVAARLRAAGAVLGVLS